MAKRKKIEKTDGLGPHEIKKLREAIQVVWHRCHARALVVKRCTGKDGFTYCEKCKARTPKLKIDHIKARGLPTDGDYIARVFCPSKELMGMCKWCHDLKTKMERDAIAPANPKRKKKPAFCD